ncbi:MAG: 3-deoxy-D-manno-octulosonic acid transferase [Boseongicola sp.]
MTDNYEALKPLPPPNWRFRLMFPVWQVFVHLALPFALLFFVVRSRREPLYRAHFSHRFGFGPVGKKGSVWIFATSLGETRAVSPLIRDLLARGHDICLSHSSPAGLSEGKRLFDDPRITHRYVPFDFIWSTWLFLVRLRPSIGLVVEGEFWPGHLQLANWLGIPILHINGNLHENSLRRAKRFWGLRLEILKRFNAILTKSEDHRARYLSAGVNPERILIVGELKFDQWVRPDQMESGTRLRSQWAGDRKTFLIASSVLAEEADLIALVERLLALKDPPRVIWAPRSQQRFNAVAEALESKEYHVLRRSNALSESCEGELAPSADILVADSIGEMNIWYQMADLVFVGATLADKGGHNISEPLALARPVVIGPSIYGITFPALVAANEGAVRIVKSAEELSDEVTGFLEDNCALKEFTTKASSFADRHVGATARTVNIIEKFLALRHANRVRSE